MDNKKKLKLILIIGFISILTILGITFAFYNYTRTGENNKLIAGEVYLRYIENNQLTLSNAIPETKASALSKDNNIFKFQIEGKNTSTEDIFYDIIISQGDKQDGKRRLEDGHIRIYLERDGVTLIDGELYDDWYNQVIYTDKMPALTNDHTVFNYELRMWIDEDVTVSDTDLNADYNTTTWNNSYASLKVHVNSGGVVEKLAYLENTYPSFWDGVIANQKNNITTVNFVQMEQSEIDTRYESATIKYDATDTTKESEPVVAWLEDDPDNSGKYIMNVASSTTIVFPESCNSMFYSFANLVAINFDNVDTSQVTDMGSMFWYCTKLTSLDLSKFNTRQVTDMDYMFSYCVSLTSLDLSSFNTRQVTDMSNMFYFCNKLTSLDVSSFNTRQVTDMESMFDYCEVLASLDVSAWDTSRVIDMSRMFYQCYALTSLDVSRWNTSQVSDMEYLFFRCQTLTSLDVSNWNTSQVTNMSYMFSGCNALTILDVTNFDTSQVTNMGSMFSGCNALTILDVTNFDTSQVTNMSNMFGCASLKSLDVTNFDTAKVTNMSGMFSGCSALTSLDVTNFDTRQVTNMSYMFWSCSELTSLDVTKFVTSQVTGMDYMFRECESLTSIDLSNFNTSQVKYMSYMFYECFKLTSLDLSSFVTSQVTNMQHMFGFCEALTSLDLSSFTFNDTVTGSSNNHYYLFRNVGVDNDEYTTVIVKSSVEQTWILGLGAYFRPEGWTTANVIVKSA